MTTQELHSKAIEFADLAFISKQKGDFEQANILFVQAFKLEKEAAFQSKEENIGEPTVSVLLKSAATLAMNANFLTEAEDLIIEIVPGSELYNLIKMMRN